MGPGESEELFGEFDDVKGALLSFSRRRPDVLFGLPPPDLEALAAPPLLNRERNDRKLRNADARFKGTYASARPGAGAADGEVGGGGVVPASPTKHASTQDLMRVLWFWATAPPGEVAASAPGLVPALRRLLRRVRALAASEPEQTALERASRLALGTPTAAQLEERAAAQAAAAAAEEGAAAWAPGGRRRERGAAFDDRRRKQTLRAAAEAGQAVQAGDWLCGSCGSLNWRDRRRCFR
ncbi:hypothetical protein GPECTOR_3g497 [Gonium pectorale]|uniref:RanBP2-type domain-containing protein n=1 Tax=Gonium pectorale TaxID=33097 RepID=A0A150H0G6_GONPE|nr:hypothetical protein GPECTOR_3g497 [Gonium pectorale]|eukprot:KXZ55368.1 hypothetical protein GPECTOR_3g497 [Gonium pectorale]